MPNRILRDGVLTSERVNSLTWPAEVFYRRLMSVVDDFGRFYAKPELIRAACYPLQLDKVGNQDVAKWLGETQKAGLVMVYTVEGKAYLELLNFKQQVRAKQSKFPCHADAKHVLGECVATAHLDVDGDVVVDERKTLSGKPDLRPQAIEILNFLNAKAKKAFRPVDQTLRPIIARLRDGYSADDLRAVVVAKCREWLPDPKMAYCVRPKTLFAAENFANYEGQLAQVSHEQTI